VWQLSSVSIILLKVLLQLPHIIFLLSVTCSELWHCMAHTARPSSSWYEVL
jgi:hypothetical protein